MGRPATESGRRRLFYGWVILAVSAVGLFALSPGSTSAISVFVEPLSREFGWSRTAISGAVTLATVGCAILSPLLGVLLDRYGPRLIMVLATIVLGAALAATALIGTLLQFYITFGLARIMAMGVISLACIVVAANWFVRKRGRAVAIALLGESVGLATIPLAAQLILNAFGWRVAWLALAIMVWVVLLLPAALLLRRRPEDMGLRPDGILSPSMDSVPAASVSKEPVEGQHSGAEPQCPGGLARGGSSTPGGLGALPPASRPEPVEGWALGQAVRTPALWLVLLAVSLAGMTSAGITVHLVAFLTDNAMSSALAAVVVSVYALSTGAGRLFWGFLAERIPIRLCLIGTLLSTALGAGLLLVVGGLPVALAYAVVFGFGIGGTSTVEPVLWADYFGRASLGKIQGFTKLFRWGANAAGPLLAGLAYDLAGGYFAAFAAFGLALALSGSLVVFARPPHAPTTPKALAPSS